MARAKNPSRGEEHYHATLTADDVRLIRAAVAERARLIAEARKLSDRALAEKFECHPHTIWKVSSREGWAHVKEAA